MSTVTTITIYSGFSDEIDQGPAKPFPSIAWLTEQADDCLGPDWGLPSPSEGSTGITTGYAFIQWADTRWNIDWIIPFCEAIAVAFPVTVELIEEWDNRDADEAGAVGRRWQHGKLVATGALEFIWTAV